MNERSDDPDNEPPTPDPDEYRLRLEERVDGSVSLGEAAREWIRDYARYFRSGSGKEP